MGWSLLFTMITDFILFFCICACISSHLLHLLSWNWCMHASADFCNIYGVNIFCMKYTECEKSQGKAGNQEQADSGGLAGDGLFASSQFWGLKETACVCKSVSLCHVSSYFHLLPRLNNSWGETAISSRSGDRICWAGKAYSFIMNTMPLCTRPSLYILLYFCHGYWMFACKVCGWWAGYTQPWSGMHFTD